MHAAVLTRLSGEIRDAYRRHGSRLRPTVQPIDDRRLIPAARFCSGFWFYRVGHLDLDTVQHRRLVRTAAAALGRKTDELIIAALAQTEHAVGSPGEGLC